MATTSSAPDYPTNELENLRVVRPIFLTSRRLPNPPGRVYHRRRPTGARTRTRSKWTADSDLKQLHVILTCALVSGTLLVTLKIDCRRHNRTRPDVHVRPGRTHPDRTAGAPPRRAGYTPLTLPIRPPSVIPMLRPEFFQSNFWHQFHAQRKSGTTLSYDKPPTCTTV